MKYTGFIFMVLWHFPMDVLVKNALLQIPRKLQVCARKKKTIMNKQNTR